MIDSEGRPSQRERIQHMAAAVALVEVAVSVKADAPWVGGQGLKLGLDPAGEGIQAVGGGINPAHHAERGFELGTVKNAVTEKKLADGVHGDHAPVVGVGDIHAPEHFLDMVGLAIAVAVLGQQDPGLRGDEHSFGVERDAVYGVELV